MKFVNGLEDYLIKYLAEYNDIDDTSGLESRLAIRALMNITKPVDVEYEFYEKQDEYLKGLLKDADVKDSDDLVEIEPKIALYEGDITLLKVDVVVNPTNETLEGSYEPLDDSICSAIHSFAGLQVRRDCIELIERQDRLENVGECKVTKAYNLPAEYIFHTVVPTVDNELTESDKISLKNCYLSCLKRMEICKAKSIAFPVIIDKQMNFPFLKAVKIAVETVREYIKEDTMIEKAIFVLENNYEYETYERVLTDEIVDMKLVKKFNSKRV